MGESPKSKLADWYTEKNISEDLFLRMEERWKAGGNIFQDLYDMGPAQIRTVPFQVMMGVEKLQTDMLQEFSLKFTRNDFAIAFEDISRHLWNDLEYITHQYPRLQDVVTEMRTKHAGALDATAQLHKRTELSVPDDVTDEEVAHVVAEYKAYVDDLIRALELKLGMDLIPR